MTCVMCKGSLEDRITNFIADFGDSIVIVKGVPSQVCMQCGEVSYTDEVARQLERIVSRVRDSLTEIAVVYYKDAAA